ncbi:riboflavin synthase subunit alpha [Clostridiales bacterium PH28_bin88]|nr:riboflavin synthase subunit alpha [Clostridiales bacterium PH28_bin88]
MFTGLVEELGAVQQLVRGADSARLSISAGRVLEDVKLGDSIAVNGVCLTAVEFSGRRFEVEVMAETLAKTNLGSLKPGDRVNLERALRVGDRLGGHLVSGHIDGVGTIKKQERRDIAVLAEIEGPPEALRFCIPKGSIAVDGVSLTVVTCTRHSFWVSLIPHTAQATTLGFKRLGDTVNLEADMLAKYVERMLNYRTIEDREAGRGVSMELLAEHGFI